MLTQDGGDRWAAAAPIRAAIAAALGAAPDDEIREAFGLAEWRAVTAAHRARYGEHFEPIVYREMVRAMRLGVGGWGGKLAIKDFAVFQREAMAGELFPVTQYGPCIAADMFEVDVTISAGDGDFVEVRGEYEGRWARWLDPETRNTVEGFPAEWYSLITGIQIESASYFVVPGEVSLVLDYSGYLERKIQVVAGLLVRGQAVPSASPGGGGEAYYKLVVSDAAPEILGRVQFNAGPEISFGGPYQNWVLGRPYFKSGAVFSRFAVDAVAGRAAEGLLSPGAVHDVNAAGSGIPQAMALDGGSVWNYGGHPLGAESWGGCFPRKKKLCRVSVGGVEHFEVVDWIGRAQWLAWYGGGLAEWVEAGAVVPGELVGERYPGGRIYAKFAPAFVAALNEAPE